MHKFKNWYEVSPLRLKISFMYLTLIVAVVIFLVFSIGYTSSNILLNNAIDAYQKNLFVITEKFDLLINRMENESLYIALNQQYQSEISDEEGKEGTAYSRFSRAVNISYLLTNFLSGQKTFNSLRFYEVNGKTFSDNSSINSEYFISNHQKAIEEFLQSKNLTFWMDFDFNSINYLPTEKSTLSLMRKVYYYTGAFAGTLEMNVGEKQISALYQNSIVDNMNVFIVNKDNIIVSSPNHSDIGMSVENQPFCRLINSAQGHGGKLFRVDNITQLVIYTEYQRFGWKIIGVIPKHNITSDTRFLIIIVIVIGALSIFISFLFTKKFAALITSPINNIETVVSQVSEGNYNARITIINKDELGILSGRINQMIENILQLMESNKHNYEQKRIYELGYIQMQMNPHFLYNSLETICGMIEAGEYKIAIRTINDISRFYRSVLNGGDTLITVNEEMQITLRYLKILKHRYAKIFKCEYNIPDEMLNQKIIKLVLQPIVENAVLHGITGTRKDGLILISGIIDGDDQYLIVKDNGKGISKDKWERIFSSNSDGITKGQGFGIRNIDERIKLHFGNNYGLTIDSCQGTQITIKFPYQKGGDANEDCIDC